MLHQSTALPWPLPATISGAMYCKTASSQDGCVVKAWLQTRTDPMLRQHLCPKLSEHEGPPPWCQ